jgi:hypothetical protein
VTLDLTNVPNSKPSKITDAIQLFQCLEKLHICVPERTRTQTYKISNSGDSRVDYVGIAKATLCQKEENRRPVIVTLYDSILTRSTDKWVEAKWQEALHSVQQIHAQARSLGGCASNLNASFMIAAIIQHVSPEAGA